MSALIGLDKVVRPITTAVSGAKSLTVAGSVRKTLAWLTALSKVSGSSAMTGQFNSCANSFTASALKPPRSCPMTKTPRVDLV